MSETPADTPPARTAVVVRAGPSRKRPIIIDAIVGLIGLSLMVSAAAMVEVLPEEEEIIPQYKAIFQQGILNPASTIIDVDTGNPVDGGESKYAVEGDEVTWTFDFTADNIYEVSITIRVPDDHPATLEDLFTAYLEAPNGTTYESPTPDGYIHSNAVVPKEGAETSGSAIYYEDADPTRRFTLTYRIGAPSGDYLFSEEEVFGDKQDRELFEIENEIQRLEGRPDTIGHWVFHVRVESAGDCPNPNAIGLDVERAAKCRLQNDWENRDPTTGAPDPNQDNTQDDGNPVILSEVKWKRYEVRVEEQ